VTPREAAESAFVDAGLDLPDAAFIAEWECWQAEEAASEKARLEFLRRIAPLLSQPRNAVTMPPIQP
jgi:hypothetical protein